ncbi:Gfo/Idh/MocA family protein [Shewanella sp. 10N.286.52.A9]|uniref:Gfo/Idh/MocA family protein n=1 Tax=Shewanella sp. 10N.286.52.A9 TaxID=3229711 RepID=UPI00354EAF42
MNKQGLEMKQVSWGIIGAGRIAHQFAADMSYVDNSRLYAIAARDSKRAEAFKTQYDICQSYGDYDSLFNDENVDAIYIATPHNFHFEQAKAAILAGKAVLCEKPITISTEEAKVLYQLAKQKKVYLLEGMWTYFLPAIQQAKEWVKEGHIGNLMHIKADFGYPQAYEPNSREYAKELAGGCVYDMGVYPIAITQLFINETPISGFVTSHLAPNGIENDAAFIFEYENVTATLATSFRCKLQNWAYIIGDKGYIAIPGFWRASQCFLYQGDELISEFNDKRKSIGFNFEIEAAANDILAGKLSSNIVTEQISLAFQARMEWIKSQINQ